MSLTPASEKPWWHFDDLSLDNPASGVFTANHASSIGRLYFPLVNEAGMLSWTSPTLQGSPASGQHEYAAPPLTAEDLPHVLIHRDFWIVVPDYEPFSVSGLDPESLKTRARSSHPNEDAQIKAGPGWFSLERAWATLGLTVKATLWCPSDLSEKIELMAVEVRNNGSTPVSFMPYAALPLYARSADNVRDHRHVTALLHRIQTVDSGVVVTPDMSFDERGHRHNHVSYAALGFGPGLSKPEAIWPIEESFLGEGGTFAAPGAVWNQKLSPDKKYPADPGHEAIGGFRFKQCALAPGEQASFVLVTGIFTKKPQMDRWAQGLSKPDAIANSLARTQAYWLSRIHRVGFATADSTLNNWLTWVGFQPTLRRLYGNSYLPQFDYGRGGRGWRDLWQDCLALLLSDPSSVRPMLVHNFGGIRIDGSNATIIGKDGSFIADRNSIPRTWMDHGVWPTLTTLLYVDQTGSFDFLLEERSYFRDPQIFRCRKQDPTWSPAQGSELRGRSTKKVYRGTLLEHMILQHVSAFFNVGEHNLCLLEGADWNDGLDMASERGEAVAFSAFYAWNLRRLADTIDLLSARGIKNLRIAEEITLLLDRLSKKNAVNYSSTTQKKARLQRYFTRVSKGISGKTRLIPSALIADDLRAKANDLAGRIQTQEWVTTPEGSYFNGYYDNRGRRVEGMRQGRMRMTLTGQVFPLMSGIATDKQMESVISSVKKFLREAKSMGIRLNTNFGQSQPNLGRAFSFAYGEKENGAVFSHMAIMYAYALYVRRQPAEGRAVWQSLYRMATDSPVSKIFPCLPEYFNADNRGMYGYLTGSASWLIYLLLTRVYGLRGEAGDLRIDPQLAREDFGSQGMVRVQFNFADRPLVILIENPENLKASSYKIASVTNDSTALPIQNDLTPGVLIPRSAIRRLTKTRASVLRIVLEKS